MKQLKSAFDYKLNIKKVNELLHEGSKLNGFEKHTIQEGLKELLFGNGPIEINAPGENFSFRDLTPAMKHYLLGYGVIQNIEESDAEKMYNPIVDQKTGRVNLEYKEVSEKLSINSIKVTIGEPGFEFKDGIQSTTFNLAEDFDSNNLNHVSNIHIISNKNIYYSTKLVVKAGEEVPFFSQIEAWKDNPFEHNQLNAVLDLRTLGIFGSEFTPSNLNCCGHSLKAAPVEFILTIKHD